MTTGDDTAGAQTAATTVVALFGGSFNPPHVAHQMACLWALQTCAVDEVWLVPTFRHAFAKPLAPFSDRFAMCERLTEPFGSQVRVSAIERELAREEGAPNRTLDTVLALRQRHPRSAFRIVIGADILAETGKWYRWDEIARLAPPIVVGRAGYDAPPGSASLAMPAVSSTEIRGRLRDGRDTRALLPRRVIEYIAERGLYR